MGLGEAVPDGLVERDAIAKVHGVKETTTTRIDVSTRLSLL